MKVGSSVKKEKEMNLSPSPSCCMLTAQSAVFNPTIGYLLKFHMSSAGTECGVKFHCKAKVNTWLLGKANVNTTFCCWGWGWQSKFSAMFCYTLLHIGLIHFYFLPRSFRLGPFSRLIHLHSVITICQFANDSSNHCWISQILAIDFLKF